METVSTHEHPHPVVAFKVYYFWRIVMQLRLGSSGRDFAAYVGVLEPDDKHANYEPLICGGGGEAIPNAVKISYADAKANFARDVEELEKAGLRWRN